MVSLPLLCGRCMCNIHVSDKLRIFVIHALLYAYTYDQPLNRSFVASGVCQATRVTGASGTQVKSPHSWQKLCTINIVLINIVPINIVHRLTVVRTQL